MRPPGEKTVNSRDDTSLHSDEASESGQEKRRRLSEPPGARPRVVSWGPLTTLWGPPIDVEGSSTEPPREGSEMSEQSEEEPEVPAVDGAEGFPPVPRSGGPVPRTDPFSEAILVPDTCERDPEAVTNVFFPRRAFDPLREIAEIGRAHV